MKCKEIKLDNFKYITPSIRHRSVKGEDSIRVIMAKKQLEKYNNLIANGCKKEAMIQRVIYLTKEILLEIGMKLPNSFNCIINIENGIVDYDKICEGIDLANKNDIVWIKLNENGCISVIGTSRDICFDDTSTNSGKINSFVKQEWDKERVLIFPLVNIPEGLNRSDVESIIGNYLIDNDIPILDYYSHTY